MTTILAWVHIVLTSSIFGLLLKRKSAMAIVDEVVTQAAISVAANKPAVELIKSIPQRIADAIAKALENGATAEQLAPLTAVVSSLKTSSDEVTAAVASVA